MITKDNMEHIAINVGGEHNGGGVAASIAISTKTPTDIGGGCTVYLFEHGRLKYMDILFSMDNGSGPVIERVRAHSDLSPLDHVCVDAIMVRYEGNPPNEVFCILEKLDSKGVRNLSVLDNGNDNDLIDVEVTKLETPSATIAGDFTVTRSVKEKDDGQ